MLPAGRPLFARASGEYLRRTVIQPGGAPMRSLAAARRACALARHVQQQQDALWGGAGPAGAAQFAAKAGGGSSGSAKPSTSGSGGSGGAVVTKKDWKAVKVPDSVAGSIPTTTLPGQAFVGDLRSTSGIGLGDGKTTHTSKWLTVRQRRLTRQRPLGQAWGGLPAARRVGGRPPS